MKYRVVKFNNGSYGVARKGWFFTWFVSFYTHDEFMEPYSTCYTEDYSVAKNLADKLNDLHCKPKWKYVE